LTPNLAEYWEKVSPGREVMWLQAAGCAVIRGADSTDASAVGSAQSTEPDSYGHTDGREGPTRVHDSARISP
jgi:hypothetical protein